MPGVRVFVGDTDAEAREIEHQLQLADQDFDRALGELGRPFAWHDFRQYDLDAPFPDVLHVAERGFATQAAKIVQLARDNNYTLRETVQAISAPRPTPFAGSPETVASEMQRWFEGRALDGYNIHIGHPAQFRRFLDDVLPILRERGLVRADMRPARCAGTWASRCRRTAIPEPEGSRMIRSLSFLSPGNFPDDDPYAGLEDTLRLFELGEQLGFDGAWIRQRHLEHGVSAAAVFLAAAAQRTRRVQLGTAVIPIGYESPFRLAEDLSTADVLSRGRLQVGLSAGRPPHLDLMGPLVFDGDWRGYDFSHGRIARLIQYLRSEYLGGPDTVIVSPGNVRSGRGCEPVRPRLVGRLWYSAPPQLESGGQAEPASPPSGNISVRVARPVRRAAGRTSASTAAWLGSRPAGSRSAGSSCRSTARTAVPASGTRPTRGAATSGRSPHRGSGAPCSRPTWPACWGRSS